MAFLKHHLYYPSLRHRDDLDLTRFTEALGRLNDEWLDELCDATPEEFGWEHLGAIREHTRTVRDEGAAFAQAVMGVLR